ELAKIRHPKQDRQAIPPTRRTAQCRVVSSAGVDVQARPMGWVGRTLRRLRGNLEESPSKQIDNRAVIGPSAPMNEVTRILKAIEQGDPQRTEELLPLVYDELRKIAGYKMTREASGHTLQATALVHEAWLRLVGSDHQSWQNR